MELSSHYDPFLWDPDAVTQHLCSLPRPCTRDPAALASKIAEEGIDGNALLTFEFVCSRRELFECLDIRLGCHKASLGRAILSLRAVSPAFRRWKLALDNEQQLKEDAQDGDAVAPPPEQLSNADEGEPAPSRQPSESAKRKLEATPAGESGDATALNATAASTVSGDAVPSPDHHVANPLPSQEHPPKRKRVVPLLVTGEVPDYPPLPPATEADAFTSHPMDSAQEQQNGFLWEQDSPQAYLGKGVMNTSDIKAPGRALTTQVIQTETSFFTTFPVKLTPGMRLTASRVMKRHLIKSGRREALLNRGEAPLLSPTSSDDGGEILELFDLPEDFDEITLREIEDEKAELQQEEARKLRQCLGQDRVHALLQEAAEKLKAQWEETKLPKYQRKAYKLWTDAINRHTRTSQILQARQIAKRVDCRLQELRTEILDQMWSMESQVSHQAKCLEQSLEDKFYHVWLADMLESRVQPPKPESLPRPKRPRVAERRSADGDEILTSSDEDGDFIVPDDEGDTIMADGPGLAVQEDHAAIAFTPTTPIKSNTSPAIKADLTTPMKAESPLFVESPLYVDLTQADTPDNLNRSLRRGSVIDLTTPAKPRTDLRVPSTPGDEAASLARHETAPAGQDLQPFGSVEQIGSQQPSHWANLKDRERLIICLLWKMTHSRRVSVLDAARNEPSDILFALSVKKQLSNSGPNYEAMVLGVGPEALAFDMTRLFLCFIRVKNCKQSRIVTMSASYRKKLTQGEGEKWEQFLALLNRVAPDFPQDSQIYRTDAFDDELADLGEDEAPAGPQDSPSKSRKNAPKEIVRNKEAVDLREREKRRLEEQEARRRKLRADLDTLGSMSQDKSRLIINETKQEDQPFIYVNERASMRIKDHQVDGVRFMWNQIVLDGDSCQGCLLAHSMGLGKTMQVITLLVAIQEAATSSDPAVRSQIPHNLHASKTLVLCPAGLVDNWMDELLFWAPDGLLGPIRKVEAALRPEERRSTIFTWAKEGGILVIGYTMLQKVASEDMEVETTLVEEPNLVVADEAHVLKNPDAKVNQVCSRFTTRCRIALTGSPLANNVEEYYSMINWVAPNFLGPVVEFREIYAQPIQQGLWGDSEDTDKRLALKMLAVLKDTVAPKVHRRTIKSCDKDDLPPKHEFVICVAPTEMQQRLYKLYLWAVDGGTAPKKIPQSRVFTIASELGLLCNHPRCFRQKMAEARQGPKKEGKAEPLPKALISAVLKETNGKDIDNPSLSAKSKLLLLILDEARRANDKVLVFSQSLPTLDYLTNLLQMRKHRVCRLDGGTVIGMRQEMVKSFNSSDLEVYLISTNAGGVGLNIQGANRVVIFDFKWNPVQEQQAVGRAYRIGQTKPVFVYRFVVAGTFEEDLQNKAVFKTQLAARVVDKRNPLCWSKRLGNLLHPILDVPAKSLGEFVGVDRILDTLIGHNDAGMPIRYIVSTDTFEEEDPDVNLTAQERRAAEDMVRLNRLRLTNPEEYQRQREEEGRRQPAARTSLTLQHDQWALQRAHSPRQNVSAAQAPLSTEAYVVPVSRPQGGFPPAAAPTQQATSIREPYVVPVSRPQGGLPAAAAPSQQAQAASGPHAPFPTEPYVVPASRPQGGFPAAAAANQQAQNASAPHAPFPTEPYVVPARRPQGGLSAAAPTQQAHGVRGNQPQGGLSATQPAAAAAPVPMTGANTYFGGTGPPAQGVAARGAAAAAAAAAAGPKTAGASITLSIPDPSQAQAQARFENGLRCIIETHQPASWSRLDRPPERMAREVTAAICDARQGLNQGPLMDGNHWRLLNDKLHNPRFALLVAAGHYGASYLARTDREQLTRRVSVLDGLPESDFAKLMEESGEGRDADPVNLENLQRPAAARAGRLSSRAIEDMQVMWEAADNRRRRGT